MSLDSLDFHDDRFKPRTEYGSLKHSVYEAAVDVLPETLFTFRLGEEYEETKRVLENAIVESGATDTRELQIAAQRAFDDHFEKRGKGNPELSRLFLSKLKQEMGTE